MAKPIAVDMPQRIQLTVEPDRPNLEPYVVIGGALLVSALIAGLLAAALHRWAKRWGMGSRVVVAAISSSLPAIGLTVFVGMRTGNVPPPDILPYVIAIIAVGEMLGILVLSTPAAWLVSWRMARKAAATDVFN